MISDELGIRLHDRETRGELLTPEEQTQLDAWYAQQDAAEAMILEGYSMELPDLAMLQNHVENAVANLSFSVENLQRITVENQLLREEILGLKQQLAQPRSA
jgi:hypothetical protein